MVDGEQRNFRPMIRFESRIHTILVKTANRIVRETEVSVRPSGDMVHVEFQRPGIIGNFAKLRLRVLKATVQKVTGGHEARGEVVLSPQNVPVHLFSIAGTAIDTDIAGMHGGSGKSQPLRALVLFSLSPDALLAAAQGAASDSDPHDESVEVEDPLLLILIGKTP